MTDDIKLELEIIKKEIASLKSEIDSLKKSMQSHVHDGHGYATNTSIT